MDPWQAKLDFDMDFAAKTLRDDGELRPMAVITDKAGMIHIVALDMSDDDMKEKSFRYIRLLCVAHEADSLSMMGEMWMRSVKAYDGESPEDHKRRATSVRPREMPDRQEVVMVQCYYRNEAGDVREVSQAREIMRGADGKPTGLAPPPTHEVTASEGDMTELLPKRPPNAEKVRYAKEMLKRFPHARPIE